MHKRLLHVAVSKQPAKISCAYFNVRVAPKNTTVKPRLLHIFRQHTFCAITKVCAIIEAFKNEMKYRGSDIFKNVQ